MIDFYAPNGWRLLVRNYAPALITVFVLIIHRSYQVITLAPVFPFVIMSVWHGNIYTTLFTTIVVCGYTLLTVEEPVRTLFLVGSLIFTVAPLQYFKWNSERAGSIRKLLERVREAHSLHLSLMVNWPDMTDEEKWDLSQAVFNENAQAFTLMRGWHLLAEERDSLREEDE